MNRTVQIAPVRKTLVIDATPERTFAVFTAGIDRWWPKSHGIGTTPIRKSFIEPFVGGRTRLELEHRNFERMGAAAGETMRGAVDGGWPGLLELLAAEAARGARR